MRAIWGVLLIATLGFGEARAQASEATFEGWSAVCDDVGECSTWASAGGWAEPSYILLRRQAGGRWSAHFGVTGARGEEPGEIEIKLIGTDGRLAWTRRLYGKSDDRHMREAGIDAAQELMALREAMASGKTAEVVTDGRIEPWRAIPLAGAASALHWIDAHEPDPRRAVIRRAPAVSQANLPKAPPAASPDCAQVSLYRLSPGKVLSVRWCSDDDHAAGAYTDITLLDERGRRLPGPVMEGHSEEFTPVLANVDYDPKTRSLSAFQPGEYRLGSCGADTTWIWDGAEFRAARLTEMLDCISMSRTLWPSHRNVRVVDAEPSQNARRK